jgi:hypothetical protein
VTLRERMTAPPARRPCHTLNCEREAIREGAHCSDCTNVVWTTGRPPEIVVPEWLRHNGLAKDWSGARHGR